jgi:hypothetical protein
MLVALVAVTVGYSARPASAHVTKKFGNLSLELGWNVEPALTGQMNAAQLTVYTGSSDKPQYVINAVANLAATLQYGTVTKQLEFLPSPTQDGQYLATIIPTKEGTYTVQFKGNIQGQAIDTSINLDDVASADTINFPPTGTGSSSSGSGGPVPANLAGILDQLTNDITGAKTSADTAAQTASADQKAVQDAKNSADTAFLVGTTGIGVGIAGIVIAVVAMSKREARLFQR